MRAREREAAARERLIQQQRERQQAERDRHILERARRLLPNRTITDLEEARQIIDNQEQHQRFLRELIPRAREVSDVVPYAVPVARRRIFNPFARIQTAQAVRDEDIEFAREVEASDEPFVAVGGNNRNRRRKKRTRRKSLRKKKRKSRRGK
jgi:hypothetical protein